MKKLLSLVCAICVVVSICFISTTASANDTTTNIIVLFPAGKEQVCSVVKTKNDIFVSDKFFNDYTMYKAIEYNEGIRFEYGDRYVNASFNGEVTICNVDTKFKLGEIKTVNGKKYYSLSNVLAFLDCYAVTDNGKLLIAGNNNSIWDLFVEFNVKEVLFDLEAEYTNNSEAVGELVTSASFQKINYLKDKFNLMWSNSALFDMMSPLAEYETFYNVYLDFMNDFDFAYSIAKQLDKCDNVHSIFDAYSSDNNKMLAEIANVESKDDVYVKAYRQSMSDKLDIINYIGKITDAYDPEAEDSRKAANDIIELFSEVEPNSNNLIANSDDKSNYIDSAESNSPKKSKKASLKNEAKNFGVYSVLCDAGRFKYLQLKEQSGNRDVSLKLARQSAIQYIYFARKQFEVLKLYYKGTDAAEVYNKKISLCNSWLAKFVSAGVCENDSIVETNLTEKDFKEVLSTVAQTDKSVEDQSENLNEKQTSQKLLKMFRTDCGNLSGNELIYYSEGPTRGHIGSLIHSILADKEYFGLSSEKLEFVRTDKTHFNKIFDAISHTYKEKDVERYPSEEVLSALKNKFNIDLTMNKYDVYGNIYYEDGYFYNYCDAYVREKPKFSYKFKVSKISDLGDNHKLINFSVTKHNISKDKDYVEKGYAVLDNDFDTIYEYNETVKNISKSRKKLYQ